MKNLSIEPDVLLHEYIVAASPDAGASRTIGDPAGASQDFRNNVPAPNNAEPRPMFNGREPQYVLQSERAVHRAICFLAAQGLSYVEIAQQLGVSGTTVGYVVKQDWAEKEILDIIHKNGGDAVATVLSQQALPSVLKLVELRDSEEVAAEVQRKAANDLLDRIFGRPNQPVTHRQEDLEQMSDAELQAIIAKQQKN